MQKFYRAEDDVHVRDGHPMPWQLGSHDRHVLGAMKPDPKATVFGPCFFHKLEKSGGYERAVGIAEFLSIQIEPYDPV